jgi:hypothetical protein
MSKEIVVTDFRYLKALHFKMPMLGTGRIFIVTRPYVVTFRLNGDITTYTVPKDTPTDFASIPDWVPKWISHKMGPHIGAAVVHDVLCYHRGPWSSVVAADIFNEGMRAAGTPDWQRTLMYQSVLRFGPQWS